MTTFLIFTVAAIGTILIKGSSILFFKNPEAWNPRVKAALHLVAPAALGAIIANSLLLDEGVWRGFGAWQLAALAAVGVALWKRSAGLTMLVGAVVFAGLLFAGL